MFRGSIHSSQLLLWAFIATASVSCGAEAACVFYFASSSFCVHWLGCASDVLRSPAWYTNAWASFLQCLHSMCLAWCVHHTQAGHPVPAK